MSVSKKDVMLKIRSMGLIPVFYHSDMDILLRMVSICYQCGLRIFEFMHQRDNRGLRYFEHLAERANEFPDLIFGVGTVLDAVMTERYINAGANFIASPFLRPDMGQICEQNEKIWMPGCTTLEEIERARSLRTSVINVLPGNVLGPEFVIPIAKQYPDLQLVPSGISDLRESSLAKWFEAGVMAIKLGPQVFTKEHIALKDWSGISNNVTALLKSIKKIQATVKPVNLDSVPE